MSEPAFSLDHEVADVLAGRPDLVAVADAIAATQPRAAQRGRRPWRLALAVAALAVAGAVSVSVLPDGGGDASLLEEALAAVGRGPVVHARIEAELPGTDVVDLATGREAPQTVSLEYWFDEPRGRLRTVVRRGGVLVDELVQTRAGGVAGDGPVRTAPGSEPALDPALAGFVTRYREALESGRARRLSSARLGGRPVVWLLLSEGGVRERVAVDAETFVPVRIVPLDARGRPGAVSWRVELIESTERVEADFAPPPAKRARPFRGDVRESRPVSSGQVVETVSWPALWLGQSWRGLRLVSLERQTLTRGYPPESGVEASRGVGLSLRYAVAGERRYVELAQAPFPEPAYGFARGEATFDGNPIPAEGYLEIVELAGAAGGTATVVGQLRRDGVFVTIWAPTRALCIEAARALRRISG